MLFVDMWVGNLMLGHLWYTVQPCDCQCWTSLSCVLICLLLAVHQPSTLPPFLCSISSSYLTSAPLRDPVSLLTLAFWVSNKLVVALWNSSNVSPPAICCKVFCMSVCLYI